MNLINNKTREKEKEREKKRERNRESATIFRTTLLSSAFFFFSPLLNPIKRI